MYLSPNSSTENNASLDEFIKLSTSCSLTIGDTNYSACIDWENGISDSLGKKFFAATQDVFLQQHDDLPTNEEVNTMDLVLSTYDIIVQSILDVGNLGKSHHSMLLANVIVNPKRLPSTELVPDYAKADFSKLKESISIEWNSRVK